MRNARHTIVSTQRICISMKHVLCLISFHLLSVWLQTCWEKDQPKPNDEVREPPNGNLGGFPRDLIAQQMGKDACAVSNYQHKQIHHIASQLVHDSLDPDNINERVAKKQHTVALNTDRNTQRSMCLLKSNSVCVSSRPGKSGLKGFW